MTLSNMEKTIDGVQSILTWFVISIVAISIGVLIAFDPLAGAGTMQYLINTPDEGWQSIVLSLATTGLLLALMFVGYMLKDNKNELVRTAGFVVALVSGILFLQDIVFDSLLADILRYGEMRGLDVDAVQWMFRFLIGGISTVGEALALVMLVGMPVLKRILGDAFKPAAAYTHAPAKTNGSSRRQELERQYHAPQASQPLRTPLRPATRPVVRPVYKPDAGVSDDPDDDDLPSFMSPSRSFV